MKVSELIEMLQNCYEDADVMLDSPDMSRNLDVTGVDFDDDDDVFVVVVFD